MQTLYKCLLVTVCLSILACGNLRKARYKEPTTNRIVQLQTQYGNVTISLYDSTPLHRNNFVTLIKTKVLDSLLFHRVIQGFMVQGGDPTSKYAKPNIMLGNGGLPYTVPAEFNLHIFHKKGALAAARDDNPAKASSSTQFYIVQGKQWTDAELNQTEQTRLQGRKLADSVRTYYKTIGGTPQLDMGYTVFGQVTSGFAVIDSITNQPKDSNNRPLKDIRMKWAIVN